MDAVLIDGTGGPPISDSVVTIESGDSRGGLAREFAGPGGGGEDRWRRAVRSAHPDRRVGPGAGAPGHTLVRPDDPESALERARRARTPLFGKISSLRDARGMVDRGVTGLLHAIRDTEAIDPAFMARLRDLRIVFVPMLATEHDPARVAIAERNTKRLAEGGVPIAVGSAGDPYREMDLLVEAGLSPSEVLVAATRNGAEAALHILEDTGTLEPGKRADLLLLSANPAEDIRNLRRTARVMRAGQ